VFLFWEGAEEVEGKMAKKHLKILLFLFTICLVGAVGFYFFNNPKGEGVQASIDSEEQSLVILNPNSHPQAGDNWAISFETKGTADLTITPADLASIDDLDFVSLKCSDEERTPQILEGDVIFYPNWSCEGTGKIIHLVNVVRKHALKFQFGNQIAYAYNSPNSTPTVSSVTLNGGNAITLSGYPTTSISATGTATDTDGWADISSITGKIYRSGVGSDCATDTDNCYEDTSCTLTSTTTDSRDYSCDFDVQFYAEPTDEGTYAAQNWAAWVKVVDSQNASGTATSTGVELNTLKALNVSDTISYGSVNAGATSTGDHIATITNTGNTAMDVKISGEDMNCTTHGSIPVGNQEYSLISFNYGNGTDLTGTPTDWNLDLPKPDSDNPTITNTTYWQVGVPTGTEGTCSGTNTLEARSAL